MLIQKPRIPLKHVLLVGILPGFLKKFVYRLKGYKIGKKVSIGFGSVILGEKVQIGAYSSIGFLTIIRGKEITLGEYVSIGSTSFLDTPYIEIGDGSKINEQVFVGGLQFPDSRLALGKNCQIMQMCFINPARLIIMGDDSGIGGNCMIFGHTSWLSYFEGYPIEFKPVEIGKNVSLAWGVFVLPGSTIGDSAVVGASSLVTRTIPPHCLAVGFPARVVSKYPEFPKDVTDIQKIDKLKEIVSEMIKFFQGYGLSCEQEGDLYCISDRLKKIWKLLVKYDEVDEKELLPKKLQYHVLLSLRKIPNNYRTILQSRKVMWIEIESKEQSDYTNDLGEEVVLFLRRYGVRFIRVK